MHSNLPLTYFICICTESVQEVVQQLDGETSGAVGGAGGLGRPTLQGAGKGGWRRSATPMPYFLSPKIDWVQEAVEAGF